MFDNVSFPSTSYPDPVFSDPNENIEICWLDDDVVSNEWVSSGYEPAYELDIKLGVFEQFIGEIVYLPICSIIEFDRFYMFSIFDDPEAISLCIPMETLIIGCW